MDTVAALKLRRTPAQPGLNIGFAPRRAVKIRAHARVDKSAKSALLKSAARKSIAGSSPAPGMRSDRRLAKAARIARDHSRRFPFDGASEPLLASASGPLRGRGNPPRFGRRTRWKVAVRNFSVIGRIAALAAVGIAVLAVIYIVAFSGGSSYEVHAIFQNASQLVTGDQVEVASNTIGPGQEDRPDPERSGDADPDDQGLALPAAAPGNPGDRPPDRAVGASPTATSRCGWDRPDRRRSRTTGTIPATDTTTAVDLDEIFNTLNGPTRKGLQNVFQGSASQYQGQGQKIQQAWQYLNPAVASTSALFSEIDRDTPRFTNFITPDLRPALDDRAAEHRSERADPEPVHDHRSR